ncbi:MAG: putative transcriptional regulator [Eubacterium sp.]|jgi:AcrR family transcriptional regulator|nr:putative transcriptional regulator [Eubacterium sp.]
MSSKPVDRRVRRTKKLLLQGLTMLLKEKKVNKITVKELTELVDVNRATFYLYYKDIFDMVDKVQDEIFDHFYEELKNFINTGIDKYKALSFFAFIFNYVKEYADMLKILLGPDGDYSFVEKLKLAIKTTLPPIDDEIFKSQYFIPFTVSGCIGVIQQWLEEDMATSPEDMAKLMVEMLVAARFSDELCQHK